MSDAVVAPVRATGIGSWPGTSAREAVRTVRDLLVDGEGVGLPHCPETPARGPGADIIGRAAGLLVDLPVDLQPSGWRFVDRPGLDAARTASFHGEDLDELAEAYDGYVGALKVQVAGPWTLAASLRLNRGERVVADPGAVADLVASLADGIQSYVSDVRRLVPGAEVVLQVDEPSLPAVLAGEVPTPSGYGTVRAVEPSRAEQTLRDVLLVAPSGGRVVHCCASDAPLALLRAAGADALAIDAGRIGSADLDALGEAIEAGMSLWLGVLPSTDTTITLDAAREQIKRLWSTLGFPLGQLAGGVVPTPACGLAGATPAYARRVHAVLRDVGRSLLDDSA